MSHPHLVLVLGALAVIAAGVPAWARLSPASFWLGVRFPVKAIRVRLTWPHVAASCGLASERHRWRWTLDAVPVAGTLKRTSVLLTPGRRMRRVPVIHAPGLGLLRPSRMGWTVRIRLRDGQVPGDYARAAEQLAHAWQVHAVRVTASKPGRVLWLNGGVPAPTVARRAGHSVDVLLRVYANCIDGDKESLTSASA